MSTAVVILAAGRGSRMNSDLPKVLHTLAGAPLVAHALRTAQALEPERIVVVTGHESLRVEQAVAEWDADAVTVTQTEQLGTAHAVLQAREALAGFEGDIIVLYADTPLVRSETLARMTDARRNGAAVVVLGFETVSPFGYGRLVTGPDNNLEAIIEEHEATPEQKEIRLCNSGVLAADSQTLFSLLDAVENNNSKGEYYLTDIVARARETNLTAEVITCPMQETLGINSRQELAEAEAVFQSRARLEALENGVTMTDPATVWFGFDTMIGRDVTVAPNVFFGPGVTIESGAKILAFCHLEGCHVSRGSTVGPFARLRPGAELAEDTHVGNFVEIKNSIVDAGTKINHLSYIGDADIGHGTNIGAGTITCNYDGVFKHRTVIGSQVFVGSNSALVAPVTIGSNAMIAAGSTITEDVDPASLAIARSRQVTKRGLGKRLMDALRAKKPGLVKH